MPVLPLLWDTRRAGTGRGLLGAAAFAAYAVMCVVLFAAAAAPSPLYARMQQEWGVSSGMIAAAFASYAGTLLLALLTLGSLAGHLGSRRVISVGMTGAAVSMLLLLAADSIIAVIVARGVQGASTGAVIGAIGAGIVRFAPGRRAAAGPVVAGLAPQLGSATGAVTAGCALQWVAKPGLTVFAAYAVLLALGAAAALVLPDDSPKRSGALASLRPRISVPSPARREFLGAVPLFVAGWMLGAFYLSLVPVILRNAGRDQHPATAGLVIGLFCVTAASGGVLAEFVRPRLLAIAGPSPWLGARSCWRSQQPAPPFRCLSWRRFSRPWASGRQTPPACGWLCRWRGRSAAASCFRPSTS